MSALPSRMSFRLSTDAAVTSALARTFLVNGAAPSPGSLLVQKELAATLRVIATGGARAYYTGAPGIFGSRIAYVGRDRNGHKQIHVMTMDGSGGSAIRVSPW